MSNIIDYIRWRGDLEFKNDSVNAIDALIFSSICYIQFDGLVRQEPETPAVLADAIKEFLKLDDCLNRIRVKSDLELLRLAADSNRFGQCRIFRYSEQFIPAQDTQFAAMTFLLDDGSAFISFRGTDNTLVGWKEDFNMCFQQTIPAQRLAQQYTREIFAEFSGPLYIGGHSKGGNMAVFAAARSSPMIQESIVAVYNNDGPGFSNYLMGDPGYIAMVPKIHTFVPQSSLIGMIMDHEEKYTIVKSSQVSIMQHDPFTWEIIGKEFEVMDQLTDDSRFFNHTIKNWLSGMTHDERNQMVDVLFDLLSTGNVDTAGDIFQLKNIKNYLKAIGSNEGMRHVLSDDFLGLIEAAKKAHQQLNLKKLE